MHELSLCQSVLEIARSHTPPGRVLCRVKMRAGPMRMIDPEVMQASWLATLHVAGLADIELDLTLDPWKLRCANCAREWTSEIPDDTCACQKSNTASPLDSNALQVTSIVVD
jgi:Zn finger protein HypA/HybF involved in hydrogenase expression